MTPITTFFSIALAVVCFLFLNYSDPQTSFSQLDKTASSLELSIIPGLFGFGTSTPAGSGRHGHPVSTAIIRVTSLSDSGPGSLRECINLQTPRICVFEVGGEIRVRSALRIRSPFITVAGQTAPEPGITISHGGLIVETHDVLLQHLAVRPGDYPDGVPAQMRDAISIGGKPPRNAFNVVIDHLSLSWAVDENISTWDSSTHDVTIANSIIAEGLHRSIHPKGPHSKGVMIGNDSSRITLVGNLIAFNDERNPYLKPGSSTEILNNVVYGWGSRGPWSLCNISNNEGDNSPVALSFIGNTYVTASWSFPSLPVYARQIGDSSRIYLRDNQIITTISRYLRGWEATSLPETPYRLTHPEITSGSQGILSCQQAYSKVLQSAGSRPFRRSRVDRRIVRQVRRRSGSIKDCIQGCSRAVGSWPAIPSSRRALKLPPRPLQDDNKDGYTNLENWLMRLSKSSKFAESSARLRREWHDTSRTEPTSRL